MTIAAVLLAAGRSIRFGGDKLAAPLDGRPLGDHAAATVAALGLPAFVVTPSHRPVRPGLVAVVNDRPETGMGRSVALGVAAARDAGADAVLIALADMPHVTVAHLRRLLDRHRGPESLVASTDGARRLPPALFGSAWFGRLVALDGDRGAAALLAGAETVEASRYELRDVDRRDDLDRAGAAADQDRDGNPAQSLARTPKNTDRPEYS